MRTSLSLGQRKMRAARMPAARKFWSDYLLDAPITGFAYDYAVPRERGWHKSSFTPIRVPGFVNGLPEPYPRKIVWLMTAVVAVLCGQYNRQDEVTLGYPAPADDSIAPFIPLRVGLPTATTLPTLLQQVRNHLAESSEHHDFPIDIIAECPKVLIGFDIGSATGGEVRVDLRLTDGHASFAVDVAADRYESGTAVRLARQIASVGDLLAAAPDLPLSEVTAFSAEDRHVIERENTTDAPFPPGSLIDLFEKTLSGQRDRAAIHCSGRSYTYRELDAAAARIALALRERGIGREQVVGVFCERSFDMLVAIIGILKAGAAYLPIDVKLPQDRVSYMLAESQTQIVLAHRDARLDIPDDVEILRIHADPTPLVNPALLPRVDPRDAAYVIFTSGSTGKPKGVLVEHQSVVNRIHWMQERFPLSEVDTILQKTPISFDVSVWELFWWFGYGASLAILEPNEERNPSAIAKAIQTNHVTVMHFVPPMLGAFLDFVTVAKQRRMLGTLRLVFASGEALKLHHVNAFYRELGHAELVNLYGPTEATVDVTWHVTSPDQPRVPIGRPISNCRLYVLDNRDRQVPVGMPGELCLAGVGLARGYINQPQLTAAKFASGEPCGEDRIYRTGDLARWLPSGEVEYLGRLDSQIKLRGYRIELEEIAHVLRTAQGVSDCVVKLVALNTREFLVAYILARQPIANDELKATAQQALPDYMVPEHFVCLSAYPLTPSGKIDYKALPVPRNERAEIVPPRNKAEVAMAGVWQEVLGVSEIGVNENFFALGGTSIHFVAVLGRATKMGFNFTFQQLFQNPTIGGLLEQVRPNAASGETNFALKPFDLLSQQDRDALPPDAVDAYPLSHMQAGMIFEYTLLGDSSYHDVIGYLFDGDIDQDVFRRAIEIAIRRDHILRTSFQLTGFSEPIQVVHAKADHDPLEILDLRHLRTSEEISSHYRSWVRMELRRRFAWDKPGNLVRFFLHLYGGNRFRYCLSQHNTAFDGWSKTLLNVEIFDTYGRLRRGEPVSDAPHQDILGLFVRLERQAVQDEKQIAFWRNYLTGARPIRVPRVRDERKEENLDVVYRWIDLPAGLSAKVDALAKQLTVPFKSILLAAHIKLLALLSGQDDVLTGYEHASRPEVLGGDTGRGVFTNSMPFRLELRAGTWADLIRQVYRGEGEVLPYRCFPMAKVKQILGTTTTLFETVFNYVHFYSYKELKKHEDIALLEIRGDAMTEFALRVEPRRHHFSDELMLLLQYQTRLFDDDHIVRIGGYFIKILEEMVATPDKQHKASVLLDPAELATLKRFSDEHPQRVRVVDRQGLLVPIGTSGRVMAPSGESVSEGQARWLANGSLQFPERQAEAIVALIRKSGSRPTSEGSALTNAEQEIAKIWSNVLAIAADELTPEDDFFHLGGGSIDALRIALALGEGVSLVEVMRNSQLAEMAKIYELRRRKVDKTQGRAGSGSEDELLVRLAGPEDTRAPSLICFPYAGGNAVHFNGMARALSKMMPDFRVFAVELPGHDPSRHESEVEGLQSAATAIAGAIAKRARGPIFLWGHCIGTAVALQVTKLLLEQEQDVRHLILAARLLDSKERLAERLRRAEVIAFEDIRRFFDDGHFGHSLEAIGTKYQRFVECVFRHDSIEGNRFFLDIMTSASWRPLRVPTTVIIAKDDGSTTGYESAHENWRRVVEDIRLEVLNDGGHFFSSTRPHASAALVHAVANARAANAEARVDA